MPATQRNEGVKSGPGLPMLLLINQYEEFQNKMAFTLRSHFDVYPFFNTNDALKFLAINKMPTLILIGYSSLSENNRHFLKLKEDTPVLRDIPLIVTGKKSLDDFKSNFSISCRVEYLKRPFLKSQLKNITSQFLDGDLEEGWKKLPEQQKQALTGSLSSFSSLSDRINAGEPLDVETTRQSCVPICKEIEEGRCFSLLENIKGHHNYTFAHSLKVASFLSIAGKAIGLKGEDLLTLTTGGLLHDVGKIATPQEILNSSSKLDEDEWQQMKRHVSHTHRILMETSGISEGIRIIAEQHHEKLDGSGYPLGLKGNQLSELARISTISDIFSALTDERSYKPAFSYEKSFSILEEMEGQIDMSLLSLFKEVLYAEKELKYKT